MQEKTKLKEFLEKNGFEKYVQKFKDEDVDYDTLFLLTDEQLKNEIGCSLGDRARMKKALEEAKKAEDDEAIQQTLSPPEQTKTATRTSSDDDEDMETILVSNQVQSEARKLRKQLEISGISEIIADRKFRLKNYPKCFIGTEFVDWMIKQKIASNVDDAVKKGQLLIDGELMHHVKDKHAFQNAAYFYAFRKEEEIFDMESFKQHCKGCLDPKKVVNKNRKGIAIKGYDPVAYFTQKQPCKGDRKTPICYEWRGAKWFFTNTTHKQLFMEDPEKYAPQFGGYCAFAMAWGRTAPINPSAWDVIDGKLYLNNNKMIKRVWKRGASDNIAKGKQIWDTVSRGKAVLDANAKENTV